MNKNESKYFNTAICFDEALIFLLDKKDIEYITVKEICNKAGVNRSTFYLHYENINDLVEETMVYINKKFAEYFEEISQGFKDKINSQSLEDLKFVEKKYLTPYLTFVKDNQKIFEASFKNPFDMRANDKYEILKKDIIIPVLDRFSVTENEREYLIAFYINGIMAIIKEWIRHGCKTPISEVEDIIIKCVGM